MCRTTTTTTTQLDSDSIVSSTEEFAILMKALTDDSPKQRNRVRISAELSCSIPTTPNLTREELKSLCWYDSQTIRNFRTNARRGVFSKNPEDENNHTDKNKRGLESCTLERQLQRHRTVQCVLSSCQKGYTPEQIAAVAQKCSKWNKEVALLQACHDFFEVYEPNRQLPDICQTPPAFPFELKRTSSSGTASSQQMPRRVRRRRTV